MSTVMDVLAAVQDKAMLARSLFFWQVIMGSPNRGTGDDFEDAAPALRRLARPLLLGPPGTDAAPVVIAVTPSPQGFDIREQALPGADAVFAFVSEPGLRLVLSMEIDEAGQLVRRLQVIDAKGGLHRRTGPDRFMLRYRLDPAILRAEDVVFLSVTRVAAGSAVASEAGLPPLHTWIEIDHEHQRHFVMCDETRGGAVSETDIAHLATFPRGAMARFTDGGSVQGVFLFVELTGDIVDVKLLGEQLLY